MKKVVIVTASWCSQCPQVKTVLNKLLEDNGDFLLEQLDADTQEDLVNTLRVRGLPTVLVYSSSEEDAVLQKTIVGVKSKSVYTEALYNEGV